MADYVERGRVFLVRHASASAGGTDARRALTPEGRDAFCALLATLGPELQVRRVLASPYARAAETAALLAEATGAPVEELDALASGSTDGGGLLALARQAGEGAALVGHNPEIAEALARAARRPMAVPPGTIAALDLGPMEVRLAWVRAPG